MTQKKYYITTPIYYVNDKPHIGHGYTTIAADCLARYWRAQGAEVFFLTGTDENAQKNVIAAAKAGQKDIQKYVDQMSACWQTTWDSLNISHDDFIRTTEARHKKSVEKFFKKVYEAGDIYQGKYEGLYCGGCEAFVKESDLVAGKCLDHKKAPAKITEENYFFRASKYRKRLLEHIEKNSDFIQPRSRCHEVINYLKNHFEDVSISRQSIKWGIPLPIDKTQVIYVWFDALINYLTGLGYDVDEEKFKKFWPADLHLVGKDIIKFHGALWPAMLMSAGVPLPRKIFVHGYFTIEGEKISKSLGNVVDPVELAQEYGLDAVRYFLLREIPFGGDGDFSTKRLRERYNSDLANGLGNLVSRVLSLAEKHKITNHDSRIKSKEFETLIQKIWQKYEEAFEKLNFQGALDATWELISSADGYIEKVKPWELAKNEPKKLNEVLRNLLEVLRHLAWLIGPILPETSDKIFSRLGILASEKKRSIAEAKKWSLPAEIKINKGAVLFPRF